MIVSLSNPGNPNAHAYPLQTQAAADALGLLPAGADCAHTQADLEAAFGIMVQQRAEALLVIADPFLRLSRLRPGTQCPRFIPSAGFPNRAG
jgi:hypothetical protein